MLATEFSPLCPCSSEMTEHQPGIGPSTGDQQPQLTSAETMVTEKQFRKD